MEMSFEDLQKELDSNILEYPPNHKFDVKTLLPMGSTVSRIKALENFAPELINGGESLLDVGCNKGFMSFYLRNRYKYIEAIEPNINFIQFANKLTHKHRIKNINFLPYRFEDFIADKMFDVVYFGQCTHYLFRDAVRKGKHPLSFLHKVKKIAKKIIAIDGAFTIEDPSIKFDSKHDNWTEDIKNCVDIQAYCLNLWPEFQLTSFNWSGDGATRKIAIWKK